MRLLESPLHPPKPPKPLFPQQQLNNRIHKIQEHPPSLLHPHPVLQFVAAKSLIANLQILFTILFYAGELVYFPEK